jgi:putative oxidoreductase
MKDNTQYLPFAGRLLIGGIFVLSGLSKLGSYGATTAAISAVGLPFAPLGFGVAIAVEIGLGFLLLIGYRARPAALALAIWCVVTAIFFHRDFADQNMFIHFMKNLMIAGGLLQIVHFGAGALSLDNRNSARASRSSFGKPHRLEAAINNDSAN